MTASQGDGARTGAEAAFIDFSLAITHLHPDDLPDLIRRCAAKIDGRDILMLLVDFDQRSLHSFGGEVDVHVGVDEGDDRGPGAAYRTERTVTEEAGHNGDVRLWVPIMDSAERLGVLGITTAGAGLDTELWEAFASTVAETLVSKGAYGDAINLTRRSREMNLAAELRWSMLPPLTFSSPTVEISGILEPAYEIAGDTFDYAVNGDLVHLAVLDAMGHGLEASQMANLAVGEYRRCRRNEVGMGEMLQQIDEVVVEQFGDARFVTGQLATLDLRDGRLRIVNAGHPRPLHYRAGTDIGDVDCKACPPMGLGLVSTELSEVRLQPGDVVVFHTDGVTEARCPDDEEFGRERLASVVAEALQTCERPAEVLRRVVRTVKGHSADQLRDDASLILLRWQPSAQSLPHAP